MNITQTKQFGKQKKKLHASQIAALDKAVLIVAGNPTIGDLKKGDLQGVRVYKFKIAHQEYLLAYVDTKTQISLLAVATHENFYRNLKKTR